MLANNAILDARTTRNVNDDDSFGGPYRVHDEIMEEILNAALEDVLALLQFESPAQT